MRNDPLFTQEIAGFILKVFFGYPDNYSLAEVHIWSKDHPKITFIIRTKFFVKLPGSYHKEFFHLTHIFKSRDLLTKYRTEIKNDLINVYSTDLKMRICRIPVGFINKVIQLYESTADYDKGKDFEVDIRSTNEGITLRRLPSVEFPYFEEKEDEALAAWITVLEYEEMPSYEIVLKKILEKVVQGK